MCVKEKQREKERREQEGERESYTEPEEKRESATHREGMNYRARQTESVLLCHDFKQLGHFIVDSCDCWKYLNADTLPPCIDGRDVRFETAVTCNGCRRW